MGRKFFTRKFKKWPTYYLDISTGVWHLEWCNQAGFVPVRCRDVFGHRCVMCSSIPPHVRTQLWKTFYCCCWESCSCTLHGDSAVLGLDLETYHLISPQEREATVIDFLFDDTSILQSDDSLLGCDVLLDISSFSLYRCSSGFFFDLHQCLFCYEDYSAVLIPTFTHLHKS